MHTTTRTRVRLLAATTIVVPLLAAAACSSGSGSNTASSGNGGGAAATSVTISEKLGPPDAYSFSPATATVSSGHGLSVVNKTDEDHKLACTPDPGVSADMLTVNKSTTQTVTFSKAGTYTCTSSTHPEAKITVTVS